MLYRFSLFFIGFIWCFQPSFAQQEKDSASRLFSQDSTILDSLAPVRAMTDPFLGMDSLSSRLSKSLEELTTDLNKVNGVLKRGLDTLEIHDDLPQVQRLLESIKNNIYSTESSPNLRSLNAAKVLLLQNGAKLNGWQKLLDKYTGNLQGLRKEITTGLTLQEFGDSAVLQLYGTELRDLGRKWKTLRVEFEEQTKNLAALLQRVTGASILTTDLLDEVNYRIRMVKRGMLQKTDPFIWEPAPTTERTFLELMSRSLRFGWRMFLYYFTEQWSFILGLFGVSFLFYFLVRKGVAVIAQKNQEILLEPIKYLGNNSSWCAALLAFTIIPFLSFSPPAIFIELFWFAMLLVATRLARADWSRDFRKYWWAVLFLFFLFGFDNIITRNTASERWLILFCSILAVFTGWKLIREVRDDPERYPSFQLEVLWLFVSANAAAVLLNIFGRFTLAKVISNSAVIGMAHALSFYLLVEIFLEALYILLEGYGKNKLSAYFQFSAIKVRFRKILVVIGILFWLLAFLWSLNILDSTSDAVTTFLQKERMIGTMEFTLGSIAVFILVFWCSFAVSNVLRFFFGGSNSNQFGASNKNKMGSWILVVRLLIISIGFLLAMGAAGIPLDKLAIIIGALGVGIGFGLQNIVNNLVSGIILAFEKPMDVGDVIEIGPNTGRVKEIGIRSSKISTFDGADIIVPNGDFISQRLTNWTHNNTYRRIELIIGVAYGTNLDIAQKAVQKMLDAEPDIVQQPGPSILWHELGNNAVNMRILFWTSDFDNWVALKSRVLKSIYQEFNSTNISIPYAQQDLHLKSIDPAILAMLNSRDPAK